MEIVNDNQENFSMNEGGESTGKESSHSHSTFSLISLSHQYQPSEEIN
jgi:hypothetical protein